MAAILFHVPEPNQYGQYPPEAGWIEPFTDTNGSVPNTLYWERADDVSTMSIQNNQLNFDSDNNASRSGFLSTEFYLTGNFDIQCDFQINTFDISAPGNQYVVIMYARKATNDDVIGWIGRGRFNPNTNGYGSDGNIVAFDGYAQADASGKIRMTRIGDTFTGYMWSGAQWEYNGNSAGRVLGSLSGIDIRIQFLFTNILGNDVNVSIDNVTITTGTGVAKI